MKSNNINIEIQAKNQERVIEIASQELNIDEKDLDITFVEETISDNSDLHNQDILIRGSINLVNKQYHETVPKLVTIYRVLSQLLQDMKINANICVHDTELSKIDQRSNYKLNIEGESVSTLIGRKGETLASLEYITKLIVSNQQNKWININIDVDNYKQRRELQLKRLAQRMAAQVVQFGRPIALEPMPPNERRIVHITLENNPGVTTNSTGVDKDRKVNIQPSILR